MTDIPKKTDAEDFFSYMVKHKLTLYIEANGYKRQLFPHWTDKEWRLSLLVNEKMLNIFVSLGFVPSRKVKLTDLNNFQNGLNELNDGIYGIFLPADYPFSRFIQLLSHKLRTLIEKIGDKDEFTFTIPKELLEQMILIKIQLNCKK